MNSQPTNLTYEQRGKYACDVCSNVPDEYGEIEHGRGCYVVSEDGGGSTWVEFEEGSQPPTVNADGLTPEQVAGLNAHSDWILAGKPGETIR